MIQEKRLLKGWVSEWNQTYPVDLIWRLKYKVQFGSPEHKSMDFLSMLFNLIQDFDIEEYKKSIAEKENEFDDELTSVAKDTRVVKMSKNEIDTEWDNLDIDVINQETFKNHVNTEGDNI